jgi:small-conductance mechanosensitive channel
VTWLQATLFGNTYGRWLVAIGIACALLATAALARRLVARHFRPRASGGQPLAAYALAAVAQGTSLAVLALPAAFCGALSLSLPAEIYTWGRAAATIAGLAQLAIWGRALIRTWVDRYRLLNIEANAGRVGTAGVLSFLAQLGLYSVLLLLALDNIPGVEITTLLASLGIGGIAVALAVQSILSDLFASLSIALDKPFELGDFIIVGDLSGSVEQIGLKTTRLRGLGGEQLIFSNADLLGSRIRNMQRMQERRVAFSIRVPYETPAAQLRAIPAMLRAIVAAQAQLRFERAHLQALDDFAIAFEVVYHVPSADYGLFMDMQQAILLGIIERFAQERIDFASSAQTIAVERHAPADRS